LSLIVILWSMVAAIALSTFVIQAMFWVRSRNIVPALAAIMSLASASLALIELAVAKTDEATTALTLGYFANIAIFLLLVPMVWFVHFYLRHDRVWLAYLITAIWSGCLLVNFIMPGNLTFTTVTSLQSHVTFWGEVWYQTTGVANPFRVLADIATLLIIIYIADASIRSFRNGEQRKATNVGGAILFFIVVAGIHSPLVDLNIIKTPIMISWAFVAISVSLSTELVDQALKSAKLDEVIKTGNIRWRALLDNVELGVIVTSDDGQINYVNRFLEKLLGYKSSDLVGQNIIKFSPGSLRHEMEERIEKRDVRSRVEFPLVSAAKEIRNINWSIVPLINSDEEITGYMAIVEDVSALKKAEAEQRDMERTIERFDRAAFLVELSAGFAHELNQPLAAILSNAQAGTRILDQKPLVHSELEAIFLDIAEDDVRASKIIHSLRRLLRKGELQAKKTSLKWLVMEVRRMLSGELLKYDIKVITDIPSDIDDIYVGRIEIQQVIMNLLVNATRALQLEKTDDPAINISAMQVDGRVQISISDNGPGIDAEKRQKVFEPFYTTREDGLGMGLAISRRIVELHGGSLDCTADNDNGTKFLFSVPTHTSKTGVGDGEDYI
jgi:PAS domain S-box-containing protein